MNDRDFRSDRDANKNEVDRPDENHELADRGLARKRAERKAEGSPLPDGTRGKMEKSFGRGFGDVRIHRDGLAESRGAEAVTEGKDIHLGAAHDASSAKGQRLLAHELTHVVQQDGARRAPQERSTNTPKLADHSLEREAEDVGARAAAGQSVAGAIAGRVSTQAPQHFESNEHKLIGDEATQNKEGQVQGIELAPGYHVSYGDIVAMAGDYFGSMQVLTDLAGKPGKGAGTREEVEYVRVVHVGNQKDQAGNFSDGAKNAADKRYYELAVINRSHFVNSAESDKNKSQKDKDNELDPNKDPKTQNGPGLNAGASYKECHTAAIKQAVEDAKAGKSIDMALAAEAFSNHYLTDSFSGGHVRTARADVKGYWDKKVPMFFTNFKGYMAEQIAKHIPGDAMHGATKLFTTDALTTMDNPIAQGTGPTIEKTLNAKGIPPIGFGDMVSAALHDFDNTNGVVCKVDGQLVTLYGDGTIMDGSNNKLEKGASTKMLAEKAVKTSVEDIHKAFEQGKSGAPAEQITAKFQDDQGMYAAERLIPQVVPDADPAQVNKSLKWDYDSVEALMGDPKIQEAMKITGQEKASDLAEIGESLDADFKKKAFKEGVVGPLTADPIKFLMNVINYVPDTGGGVFGHNTDDEAMDYMQKARSTPGGIASLTVEQKQKLIADVVAGYTSGDEEAAILEILGAKPADAPALIQHEGWHRLWKTIDGDHCRTFVEQFGPAYWQGRGLDEKKSEVKFLADGRTNDIAQETIVVILRTCTPEQVRQIDKDAGGMMGLSWDLDGKWNSELKKLEGK